MATVVGRSGIYIWDSTKNEPPTWLGDGDYAAWNPAGDEILTTLAAPNSTFLTIYAADGKPIQPLEPFPRMLRGLLWANLDLIAPFAQTFQQPGSLTPAPLWAAMGEPVTSRTPG